MPGTRRRWMALVAGAALVTAACGGGGGAKKSTAANVRFGADTAAAGGATKSLRNEASTTTSAAAETATTVAASGVAAPASNANQSQSALRAGSVDDNDKFSDYLDYRRTFAASGQQVHDLDVSERHVFTVTGATGRPVLGAHITVSEEQGNPVAELRTYADGRAFFFPKANAKSASPTRYTATVDRDGKQATVAFDHSLLNHAVKLDVPALATPVKLDVQLLVDATGSMDDEISQLKSTMVSIAERIHSLPAAPDVRFALTTYRDRGDAYVTRTVPFTGDVDAFVRQLREVEASGGGDGPESVNQGLHDAIHKVQWRGDDAVKLVLLVGDAAPHLDYDNDSDYAVEMVEAARLGIKVHALAASGLDDQGEYVFRQIAETTEGQFVFLTYGADG